MPQIFKSSCSYCGVGCGIEILKDADGNLELRGDQSHPANRGLLCSKGRTLLHTVRARDTRLHVPTLRTTRDAPRQPATWDDALSHIAQKFQSIIQHHGPDAVALYISGQCLTEEYYLANKIAKGFLGTNNIDTNSRLCMSSAVSGYKATLGTDGPPACYDDIDSADTFLIAGANPAWCHPVLFRRIEARKSSNPDVKIIVIDPRRTPSAQSTDLHLQLKPGTDVALFLGIARRLVHTNNIDRNFLANHVDGAHAYLQSLEPWTLARTAETCGIPESDIATAADWLAGNRRFLSMWTMGLNQSAVGTDKNIALISLSLLTGKIGKPGCGPFSLTGQPNAMGGREVGGMSTLLPAHRDLANPHHRAAVANFWGVPAIPANPGLTAVELFDAVGTGKVKALWIIATNPVASMPAAWAVEKALANADLVIVQDIYPTETTDLADVILPAAGWLEKTGTMTNSERRISLLEKALDPPGQALPDAEILQRFAHKMGWQKSFNYNSPAEIFAEHAALTQGTDIDITGVSHQSLRFIGPTQWPSPRDMPTPLSEFSVQNSAFPPRLYHDHLFPTPTRRAQLHPLTFINRSETPTPDLPLILTTGRIRDHWHTMTKTGTVNRLNAHIDAPFCEIHPHDAEPRHIATDDILTIRNSRGTVQVRAIVTTDIRQGVIFLPMHWGKKLAGDKGRTNNLTSPRTDPTSKEPDLKLATVEVERYTPAKRRIVIVGAGAAALAFINHHRRFNQTDDLILLGGETLPVYDRVQLPHYIEAGGGDARWQSLIRADRDSLNPHRVIFHPNTLVSRIDRATKTVTDARGRSFPYDLLILALGSRPAIHYDGPLPNQNVFTLRSRKDADAILAAANIAAPNIAHTSEVSPASSGAIAPTVNGSNREIAVTQSTENSRAEGPALASRENCPHAVIHGAGLLGIELADALRHRGCTVTLLIRSNRLMTKQLDQTASDHLAAELTNRGIQLLFHTTPIELVGTDTLTGVRVQTTQKESRKQATEESRDSDPLISSIPYFLNSSLFIFATGTLPNKELAGAAGLDCSAGILTTPHMQTSDPHIFAIGECAQLRDPTDNPAAAPHLVGTTAAADAHALALAQFLRGNLHAPYRPAPYAAILKLRNFQLAAAGITDPPALSELETPTSQLETRNSKLETITLHDPARRLYLKCLLQNDRLLGTICLGDTAPFPQLLDHIRSGLELEDLRSTLLRGTPAQPLDGPLVCSCNHIGLHTIEKAAPTCHFDLQKTCTATRAGTTCGSCRPEIANLLQRLKPPSNPDAVPPPPTLKESHLHQL